MTVGVSEFKQLSCEGQVTDPGSPCPHIVTAGRSSSRLEKEHGEDGWTDR